MGGVCPNASENGQISPPTTVRAARGDGSCPNCASALQGARETANIQARSRVIWRIPVEITAELPGIDEKNVEVKVANCGLMHCKKIWET